MTTSEIKIYPRSSFAPWSYSKWKSLNNCPLKFYLKYVLKIKVPYVEAKETTVGKAAHEVLEHIIEGSSVQESLEKVEPIYREKLDWSQEVLTIEPSFTNFRERFLRFVEVNKVIKVYQEVRIGLTTEWKPTEFFADNCFYRGVIDLCMYLQNGDSVVIDHKTGAPAAMGIKNFMPQLDVYKVLSHKGLHPVRKAASGVHFVKDSVIKIGNSLPAQQIENMLLGDILFSIQVAIDAVRDAGRFKRVRGSSCKYCEYDVDCKAKKYEIYSNQPIQITDQ